MLNVIKIILFLLVNIAGYHVIPIMFWIAVTGGLFSLPSGPALISFQMMLFGIGTWVWIGAALASVGYFFVPSRDLRTWLILAPMYCPAIYGVGVLLYYRFFAVI
jgi:hypothetical protein